MKFNIRIPDMIKYLTPLLLISFFLIGCSTPQKRAEEKAAAFSALSPEEKQMVLDSRIDEGYSKDAVYIAFGNPTYVRTGQFQGEEVLSWVYTRHETYSVPSYRPEIYTDGEGRVHYTEVYEPEMRTRRVPSLVIFFKDDSVVGWQRL